MNFDDFWQKSITHLKEKMSASEADKRVIIDNWRSDKGLTGERFAVVEAQKDGIKCLTIHASREITLPREDMEMLYGMWDDYLSGRTTRMDLIDCIPRPTYCVAVMRFLKDSIQQ